LIWSKLRTSGPAVTTFDLPCGPLIVTCRVAASMASTVAVTLTVAPTVAVPGALAATAAPLTAGFWANAGAPSALNSAVVMRSC
jgi:hypothetical protein